MALELPIVGDQSVKKQFEEIIERISFGSTEGVKAGNFDGMWLEFTSSAVGLAENTVAHKLNRVPTGYIVAQRNKAAILYNGASAWTDSNIYLISNVVSTTFRIYVW